MQINLKSGNTEVTIDANVEELTAIHNFIERTINQVIKDSEDPAYTVSLVKRLFNQDCKDSE